MTIDRGIGDFYEAENFLQSSSMCRDFSKDDIYLSKIRIMGSCLLWVDRDEKFWDDNVKNSGKFAFNQT